MRLHAITEDERKNHLKYRYSTVKRYLHKFGGRQTKFASKQRSSKLGRFVAGLSLNCIHQRRGAGEKREDGGDGGGGGDWDVHGEI
jgi:hypothetical protein